jgi:hypothetical protein
VGISKKSSKLVAWVNFVVNFGGSRMQTDKLPQQPYTKRVPNPNQPKGDAWKIATRMYVEEPFLPKQVIAEILDISASRVSQICKAFEADREAAQKREIERLRKEYLPRS